jgi:two-component system sensor histidine kinase BaeS
LSRTSFIITIGVTVITTIVLLFVGLVTVKKTTSDLEGFLVKQEMAGVIEFVTVKDARRALIEKEFQTELNRVLLIGTLLGSGLSVIAGFVLASIATMPLKKIKTGMKNLREENYSDTLAFVGDNDFDAVIDEFNKLTSQLEYEERLRRDLISDIAHELKTPITSVIGQIEGIQDGVFKPNKERINLIKDQMDRLTDLINKLQDYTHLRSSLLKLNTEKVNLNGLSEKALATFEVRLKEKNIKAEIKIDKQVEIKADKNLLEQVIFNLIDNAIKYSKATKLTIEGNEKYLSISDNGVGITKEHHKYIFERFYRVEKSRSRETGGLGLGLSIVKEIIEAHGWKIEVESPVEDSKGTRFTIRFK